MSLLWTVIFAIRFKRKKGRKFPVVLLAKKSTEGILNRKVGMS